MYFNSPSPYIGNNRDYLSKKFFYLRYKFFYLSKKFFYFPDRITLYFSKKEDRTQQVQVLSSLQYKYTTFFVEIQIPLTFRNTLTTVNMLRFAAEGDPDVLYYEEPRGRVGEEGFFCFYRITFFPFTM